MRHAVARESVGEDVRAEFGIDQLPVFFERVSQPVFPHLDNSLAGHVESFSQVGLRVPVTIPPIFEPLRAGNLIPDATVVDRGVPAVVSDGVEESSVGALAD